MNKWGNDEIKEKPEIKYSFKIEKESDLLNRIEKMVAIKNDEKNKKLDIQYREGDKKVEVSKRYGQIPLSAAMDCMKSQQKSIKNKLIKLY